MNGENSSPSNPQVDDSSEVPAVSPDTSLKEETELENSDVTLNDDLDQSLKQLKNQFESLQNAHETLEGQYKRIAADFDNFRKRQSRDQDDLRQQLVCSTLSEVLPVVDNFERARQQLNPEGEEGLNLHRSYQGLYKQLVDVLKQQGVARMEVVGQNFDPSLHEAVLREESELYKEDVIIEELQRGYHLNGRVLRHAMVKVSMGPGPISDNFPQDTKEQLSEEEVL